MMKTLGFLNWNKSTAPETVDAEQYQEALGKFRQLLLEQYQTRLKSKTGRRLPINLTAKSTDYGFDPVRAKVFLANQTIESEDIASEIDKILKKFDRLLLIGDPGAGKTTILLYAAINILHDAREPKLPLILNLATWYKGRDFAEWYAQNIAHTYSLSPVFVQELLRRNAVVPFFDGFDEVAEEYRDDCFQKMAAYFGDQSNRQLIVSSRKAAYAAAKADAPVYAEIEVQPLSLAQIKKALSENAHSQAADRALLHALEHDKWLVEAVETPFYLNTASFLFGKGQRTLADFPFKADSTEGRQAELVEIFVAEQVPEKRDRKYLHFLAEKMEEENFLVFELVKMQPDWCRRSWKYRWIIGLIVGWVSGLYVGWIFNWAGGVIPWLMIIFSITLLAYIFSIEISTTDIQIWRWNRFLKSWKDNLGSILFCAFGVGLIGVLIAILDIHFISLLYGGLVGLLISLLVLLKITGTATSLLLHISNPYQRFEATFKNSFWIIFLLPILLAFGFFGQILWEEERYRLGIWLKFLLLGFPFIFLIAFQYLHHFSLRLVLYLEGKMPLRVVTFMDRMTEQLIFEDNRRTNKKGKKMRGATWRFRHKILQDYFARHSA